MKGTLLEGSLCVLARLGDDHRHWVTHMAHLALGEQWVRWLDHRLAVLRSDEPAAGKTAHLQIGAGEDRSDAGRPLGGSGVDGAQRHRNFIPNDAYPYTTPVALTYDSGDYFKTLDMAVRAADYASFEQRRKGAAKRGKLRGIGISTYIEACAMAPSVIAGQLGARAGFYELAEVRARPAPSARRRRS